MRSVIRVVKTYSGSDGTRYFIFIRRIVREERTNMQGKIFVDFVNYLLAIFVCYFFNRTCYYFIFSLQVPLISCASPWRAGGTKNGAHPKLNSKLY